MSFLNLILPRYTYDDYLHWEGRWELIEGHPIATSRLPVPKHQRVASEIRTELTLALRKGNCTNCKAYDPLDYKIAEDTILQPDILIVCGEIKKPFLDFPPVLVVEILSPSTMLRDTNTKFNFYEQQGIKYYLIVDVQKEEMEIYKLVSDNYQLQPDNNNYEFELEERCYVKLVFENIWK